MVVVDFISTPMNSTFIRLWIVLEIMDFFDEPLNLSGSVGPVSV